VVRLAWGVGDGTAVGDAAGADPVGDGGTLEARLEVPADGLAEAPAAVVELGRAVGPGSPVSTIAAESPPSRARITARTIAMERQRSFKDGLS
jgi:hypothetical protein